MAQNSSAMTTQLLVFDTDSQGLVASIVGADATATTYNLNCPASETDCGTFNDMVTVGPWAAPSPTATTGNYDFAITMPDEGFTLSLHCQMSMTVPATCTYINIGGNNDGTPTVTYTSPASDDSVLGWNYHPVTITAGQEKLASVSASATTGSGMSSGSVSSGTSNSMSSGVSATATASQSGSQTGSMSASGSVSKSSSAASMSSASNAAAHHDAGLGSLALAGLLLTWLFK